MADGKSAIFLSYASQDAEAAQRICEALRAAGIEVFFDQSELRGGDAWDHKIRKQIRECGLFLPIISKNTQARGEGYFRLEWRLADQRTHMMGRSRPFLVPVCVDDTREFDADVPDSFSESQWTRLAGGQPPRQFVERIQSLLSSGSIARQLNVASILEGSVRRSGHTVRITAQLINGATGFHLWSETYDRDLGDMLKLQTDIANAVAGALKVTLLESVTLKTELGGTHDPVAFDAYLRGLKLTRIAMSAD
jgi:hypothetical protein